MQYVTHVSYEASFVSRMQEDTHQLMRTATQSWKPTVLDFFIALLILQIVWISLEHICVERGEKHDLE